MSQRSQLIKKIWKFFSAACAVEQFKSVETASFPETGSTCLVLFGEKRPAARVCGSGH